MQLQFQETRGGLGWALEEVPRSGRELAGSGNLGDFSLDLECVSHLCSELRPNSAFQAGNQCRVGGSHPGLSFEGGRWK